MSPDQNDVEKVLQYLSKSFPDYPFDKRKDGLFVSELVADFPNVDHVNELKRFRAWVFDHDDFSPKGYRSALRKWFDRAQSFC